jgi:UDP-N-acetylmuramyl pentapeptide phosphotransferase/UDP-N-acetylglucosamine-1-phosphate transferase
MISRKLGCLDMYFQEESLQLLIDAFCISIFTSFLLITLAYKFALGRDFSFGVRKFHKGNTSRLGGVGIVLGIVFYLTHDSSSQINLQNYNWILFLSSLPIFFGGFLDDLTNAIPPIARLTLAFISASIFWFLTKIGVERTDVMPVDWLIQWPIFAYLVSLLVIAGFTHAINIIDGFNGLASSQVILILFFLALLSYTYNDQSLFLYSSLLIITTLGFLLLNWPFGKIFLGDSGAYFLGVNVVFIGLTLVHRFPRLSPFAPIIFGIYPLVETLFSIYRRVCLRGVSMNTPDALHMHSLIYQRILKKSSKAYLTDPTLLNSRVSVYFFVVMMFFDFLGFIFSENTNVLFLLFGVFVILYFLMFKSLVSFKMHHIFQFFKYKQRIS